jgi:hypothetical protein
VYDLFVEDMNTIVHQNGITDRILMLGDFNLQTSGRCRLSTTDLESDLIEGLLSCDLEKINAISNQYGRFLDLIFSNAGADVTIWICNSCPS